MSRPGWSSCVLSLGLLGAALGLMSSNAQAVTVSISPADTLVDAGSTFQIRVVVDDVADLKAYSLVFHYGSPEIQLLDATAGDILTGSGYDYTVQTVPDEVAPPDTAWADCAQLGGSTSGPGVMLYFRFRANVVGNSPIDCLDVDLRDSLNNVTIPNCVGGMVHIIGATPTRASSWGRLKTLYR